MEKQAELRINRFRGHWEEKLPRARLSLFVSLFAVIILLAPVALPAEVSVSVSVTIGPPLIPVYAQPVCPGPGFIWIPGYWAWDPDFGYYWVPGMWTLAPFVGALWTPGYWAWSNGAYIWYEGYWGLTVGFYGGVNYGYGYTGSGYYGGYWSGGRYYYNRTVNNINVTNITTVYSKPVGNPRPTGASFNGGPGGATARPTSEQMAAARERRFSLTNEQRHHMQLARSDPRQRMAENRGRPAIAATPKPGEFRGHGVVSADRAGVPSRSQGRQTLPGERGRPSRPGATMQPPAGRPERMTPGTPRQEHGRVAPGTPGREFEQGAAPGISGREREPRFNERSGANMQPPTHERIAPGTPGRQFEQRTAPEMSGREPRINEPGPSQRGPRKARPAPQKEKNRGEQEMR